MSALSKTRNLFAWLSPVTIALCLISATAKPSSAGTLYNGWNYAIDPSYDGLGSGNCPGGVCAGGTAYEIYGIAIKDDPDTNSILIALNGNLPLTGENTGFNDNGYPVSNGNIGWGDLFLDFSGLNNFKNASETKNLFGIRFAGTNDSKVLSTGLYSNVKAVSVVAENAGWSNLWNHNTKVNSLTGNNDAGMGDLTWNDSYYNDFNTSQGYHSQPSTQIPNIIAEGNKIGDIAILRHLDLIANGFDANFIGNVGSEIFGFRLDKSLLPVGDFIASLFTECNNDAIAILGSILPPPPPPPPPPAPFTCPISPGEMNAMQPTAIVNNLMQFNNVVSGNWFDPPGTNGFEFSAMPGTMFTQVLGFPCGVDAGDKFNLFVDQDPTKPEFIGTFTPGQTFDFTSIYPQGIRSFSVTFPNALAGPYYNNAFRMKLGLDQPVGSFTMMPLHNLPPDIIPSPSTTPVPEPSEVLGLITTMSLLIGGRQLRKRSPASKLD